MMVFSGNSVQPVAGSLASTGTQMRADTKITDVNTVPFHMEHVG